jgi:hypothetical protein
MVQVASGLLNSGDIQQQEDFIWYPNPDESGSFYPAFISPSSSTGEAYTPPAGAEEDVSFYFYSRFVICNL